MDEVLDINWEKRARAFFSRLDKRREDGKYDFTIIVGDQKIRAEQNVLASGSDYFDAMFTHDTKERQQGEVEMKHVDFKCVRTCVDFIYGKNVHVSIDKYEQLMYVAHMMQLNELCLAIEQKMATKLDVRSFVSLIRVASLFGCSHLEDTCKSFAEQNFESLAEEENFVEVEKPLLKELISSQNVAVDDETKLQIVIQWVKFQDHRKTYLTELLKCLDFSLISQDVGQAFIENEPLINTDNECLQYFRAALMNTMAWSMSGNGTNRKPRIVLFNQDQTNLRLLIPDANSVQKLPIGKPTCTESRGYSVVSLDEYIYVLGGSRSVHRLKYSEESPTWQKISGMKYIHGRRPPAATLSGHLYVIGGGGRWFLPFWERYDPSRGVWEDLGSLPRDYKDAEILSVGKYIYSFGGEMRDAMALTGRVTDKVQRLEETGLKWTVLSPMNEKKYQVSASAYNGFIYVAGGKTKTKTLASFERYHIARDQWTMLPRMTVARRKFRMFAINGSLFAVCGVGAGESANTIEKYDIKRKNWELILKHKKLNACESVLIMSKK